MTQSGPVKKPLQEQAVSEVIETPKKEAPKSKMDMLIEELKAKKPEVYEQYVAAARAKRPVWIYPDLTVRIG
jgi:hypothetical protein